MEFVWFVKEVVLTAMESKNPPQDKNFKVKSKYFFRLWIPFHIIIYPSIFFFGSVCYTVFHSLHFGNDWSCKYNSKKKKVEPIVSTSLLIEFFFRNKFLFLVHTFLSETQMKKNKVDFDGAKKVRILNSGLLSLKHTIILYAVFL